MTRIAALAGAFLVLASASSGATDVQYWDPAWSPDGKRIAFVSLSEPGDLFVMNANGTDVRQLTRSSRKTGNYGARNPTWSPDGHKIAFAYGYSGIVVVNADGTSLHRIIRNGDQPAWSPRGRRIAYAVINESSGDLIVLANPDGSNRRVLAKPDWRHSYDGPTWSPNGTWIAFGAGEAPDVLASVRTFLGLVRRPRGHITKRLAGRAPAQPEWSPNGKKIAYVNTDRYRPRIEVLTLRTGRVRSLREGFHPSWSPDSRRLAYVCDSEICVMNADGSHVRQLTS